MDFTSSDVANSNTFENCRHAIKVLNDELGDDISGLKRAKELYEKYNGERKFLEDKLAVASDEAPNKITQTLNEADSAIQDVGRISKDEDFLVCDVYTHLADAQKPFDKLKELQQQIKEFEKYILYLQWLQNINQICTIIEAALVVRAEDRIFDNYKGLCDVAKDLKSSSCSNLVLYVNNTVLFWYNLLKDKFDSEFQEVLNTLKWPIVATSQLNLTSMQLDSKTQQTRQEASDRLEVLFKYLLLLQLPDFISQKCDVKGVAAVIAEFKPSVLPIELLLKQLRKRFAYHFMGKKQTNNVEKPEWYFTQVLSWINDNGSFLDKVVQPLLTRNHLGHISAKAEFMRCLVKTVCDKLYLDIPNLLFDDHLLSHTIDEAVLFDKELQTLGYSGANNQPGCLTILTTDNVCFKRWLSMERKYAVEKIDQILSFPTAWQPLYVRQGDLDEMKVPECGERMMTLIHTITGRYKSVPHPSHKLQFLWLQLELIDDFRVRLVQLMKGQEEPFESNFCPILNTVHYILSVVKEWSDLPFFVQMQCYNIQYQKLRRSFCSSSACDDDLKEDQETILATQLSSLCKSGLVNDVPLDMLSNDYVFEEVSSLLEHVQKEMISKLVNFVFMNIKAKSRPYRKDKWFSMAEHSGCINMSITPTLCPMLMILQSSLQKLKDELAVPLFKIIWQKIAYELNSFFYQEIVSLNYFNVGGAQQFNYDITRNLFPLFSEYTQRPDNYFKDLKESCIVLTIAKGSALLLMEILADDSNCNKEEALMEFNIHKLKPHHVIKILKRRTDFTK